MRQERTVQASLFDLFAGHEIGRELKAMSAWLDDHRELASLVAADLRRHGVKATGRQGLPAEAVLRCALLKQHRQLSYQELAFHLEDFGVVPGVRPAAARLEPAEVGAAPDDQRDPRRPLSAHPGHRQHDARWQGALPDDGGLRRVRASHEFQERVTAGLAKARAKGKRLGRPRVSQSVECARSSAGAKASRRLPARQSIANGVPTRACMLRTGRPSRIGRRWPRIELFDDPARRVRAPPRRVRYSITAKRLPSLLLLPHLAPLPPSKRIRRLCTGWPRHWS